MKIEGKGLPRSPIPSSGRACSSFRRRILLSGSVLRDRRQRHGREARQTDRRYKAKLDDYDAYGSSTSSSGATFESSYRIHSHDRDPRLRERDARAERRGQGRRLSARLPELGRLHLGAIVRPPWRTRRSCSRCARPGSNTRTRRASTPELPHGMLVHRPRPYQSEALAAWKKRTPRRRRAADQALARRRSRRWRRRLQRSSLVVAPTLELVRQWYDVLCATFQRARRYRRRQRAHRALPLTVTTYDPRISTWALQREVPGWSSSTRYITSRARPGATRSRRASARAVPARLTATPERTDGMEAAFPSARRPDGVPPRSARARG